MPRVLKLLPLQGALQIGIIPRALPWAKSFCPFRACCLHWLLPFQSVLLALASAFSECAACIGFCPFRACCLHWLLPFQGVLLLRASALYFCFTLRPANFNYATCRDRWFWVYSLHTSRLLSLNFPNDRRE